VARFHAAPAPVSSLSQPRMAVPPASLAGTPHWAAFRIIYGFKILAEILFLENDKSPNWARASAAPGLVCPAVAELPRTQMWAFINPPWAGLKKPPRKDRRAA